MSMIRAREGELAHAPRIVGGPLILIVDDDKDSRETARMVLEEEGYVVDVASNGRAALDRLRSAPSPRLMLVDLMMPVMDGPSLLVELESSAEHAGIPVVVMTASGPDSRTSALRYPVLRKPFNLDDLMRIVTECAPRFWDDEEPTEETSMPFDRIRAMRAFEDATPRILCIGCDVPASTRCVGCGEAFCRRCFDGGATARCPKCRSTARA
jgi:CheY-like chemotaxis protein